MPEYSKKHIGELGENIAARYLISKNFEILDRNFFKIWSGAEKCEIDIIAKQNDILHFVEVKTIIPADSGFFCSFDKINFKKQRKIEKAAQYWLIKNKIPMESKYQIDALEVSLEKSFKSAKIRFIENI